MATDPLMTVTAVRSKYPTPLGTTHAACLIDIAQSLGGGAGLLRKDGGTHIVLPDGTRVAQDIICYPDGRIFDCLADGDGAATPTWFEAEGSPVETSRYYRVPNAGPVPPLPIPEPIPPPVSQPAQPYSVQTPLGAQIGDILGTTPDSPYTGNPRAIGECVAHLLWKVQFEGYSVADALVNAKKRAAGLPAD